MHHRRGNRRWGNMRKFDLIVMAACIALLGYLGWHAFKGPRGFDRMAELTVEQAKLKGELGQITAEREALDRHVALMRPDTVDPDMLDEFARKSLEFAR